MLCCNIRWFCLFLHCKASTPYDKEQDDLEQINEDTQDWNPDLMDEGEIQQIHLMMSWKDRRKSNEDSTFAAESDNADESAETTPNDDTSDREIQCAACGNISKQRNWFLSRIGTHYVICPKCGTLRYVCHNNAGYRKE
mgnify:CR=1 FL=1